MPAAIISRFPVFAHKEKGKKVKEGVLYRVLAVKQQYLEFCFEKVFYLLS